MRRAVPRMKEKTSLALARELFQRVKQLPRPKLRQISVDGLTRSEYELLAMLAMDHRTDRAARSVTELSKLLQITPAGVTHLINPLEEVGYVERLQAPADRRIVLIGLTDKGQRLAKSLMAEVQEGLLGLVNHLGEEDSRTLIRLLSKTTEYLASLPEE